ncbi:unnamed protein product [Chondrus crispus]|uniref:Uncharacterized protein n=1 Tax=Chondrus crispus TaxID=2769 RepID=R7QJ66_CHOCR|nr:unnamed protein product [Chondrus crispus]CDF37455.1 unnamed protein product [Chondrus crispus]|eukprot:XP_005717274.1 unnamed protein product [Chondrus crispus]
MRYSTGDELGFLGDAWTAGTTAEMWTRRFLVLKEDI